MKRYSVPAASVALIRDGKTDERFFVGCDADTQFQAASISKVVNGQAILSLTEQGRLALDEPINKQLRSWTLHGDFVAEVTPRLLLAHRGGTNVPGFPGYHVGEALPNLRQILDGSPPANTPEVRVVGRPGEAYRYSGGGTMVLQRLAMDATARDYRSLAQELVLAPVDMNRSSYLHPLPNAVQAHYQDGDPLPGGSRLYPELAAAGLWSTPTDLAKLALAIAAGPRLRAMSQPVGGGPAGLGVFIKPRTGRPPLLYHYGVNAGFRSVLVFAADASFGVVLMTNGEGGRPLIPAFGQELFQRTDQGAFPLLD